MLDLLDYEQRTALSMAPPVDLANLPLARQGLSAWLAANAGMIAAAHPDVRIEEARIESPDGTPVSLRLYRRAAAVDAPSLFYWIHGGGLIVGSPAMDDAFCCGLVDNTGCVVVSPDYRLAPEFPFPAPLDDCYAGLLWARDKMGAFGVASGRIVIGGASAGGGLAAAAALKARDTGDLTLAAQVLNYPMLDDRNDTPSSRNFADAPTWPRSHNLFGWRAYLGDSAGAEDVSPYAAPARAASLKGLPPTYIAVGEFDLFRDENMAYAQRLWAAGVSTELHVYPRSVHGSDLLAPTSPICRRWLSLQEAMLTDLLA